ncbi:hypothetical protein PTTG_06875 [Puccinia triticina 1-1 BBBD Race 1]|uniref:Zn(2)-C6 fungal-type domain-containing protein n=1 Tax=Puccinia triticina (isolate 1-1 / race 1 (BBBD)) TaxID=630390 RepID=A0A180GPS1_PUCT1|nr:hypothetical protein PTTG_06875 [Puccinia triticina 1-1 BBBD Race 1]
MSENKTTQEDKPKRRRYRIPRSCDRCRSSKVKCVVENDRCHTCTRLGLKCTFADPGSLKERPPTVKDAEQLTARIRSLERLLHAVDPTLDLNNLPDLTRNQPVSHTPETLPFPTQLPTTAKSQAESHSAQTVLQDSFQSQLSAVVTGIHGLRIPSKPHVTDIHWTQSDKSQPTSKFVGANTSADNYVGPNSILSIAEPVAYGIPNFPRDLRTRYPVDDFLRLRHEEHVSRTNCFYPEPDLELDLLKIYFQHFHPLVPIIHPTTFYHLHKSGLAKTDRTFRSLCLIMFSIASRWSMDPRVQFDLAGKPQTSRHFAGLPFGYASYIGVFQAGYDGTSLFRLQAYVLLAIGSLGACQPAITWLLAEQGLTCAQECGAHREVHHIWNADPLQDYLRRQAFFQLYEIAHRASHSLHRRPLVEYDDYDLQPIHAQRGDPLGIFVNPYSSISPAVHDACVAFDEVRVLMLRLGTLRSMLPLLFKMQASTKAPGGAGTIKSLKALVDQLDLNARKWFDKVPPIFKRPDIHGTGEMLVFAVLVITCYGKFQLLIHHTLFHYQGDDLDRKTASPNPHINRCVEFAISSIQAINQLRLRKLLTAGFYWIPGDLILTVVLLACSIRKQREFISPQDNQVRRDNILLAIMILDDLELGSGVHAAAAYSNMSKIIFGLLDAENPSVLDSLKAPLKHPAQFKNQGLNQSPPSDPVSASPHDSQDVRRETSWDPVEISDVAVDATALNLPFFTTLHPPPAFLPAHAPSSHPTMPHQTHLG